GEAGQIFVTSDYGISWQLLNIENNGFYFFPKVKVFENGVAYYLQNRGFIGVGNYHTEWEILYSTDFGQTWKKIDNSIFTFDFYDVLFLSPDELIIIGEQGKVYYSKDRGEHFYAQEIAN